MSGFLSELKEAILPLHLYKLVFSRNILKLLLSRYFVVYKLYMTTHSRLVMIIFKYDITDIHNTLDETKQRRGGTIIDQVITVNRTIKYISAYWLFLIATCHIDTSRTSIVYQNCFVEKILRIFCLKDFFEEEYTKWIKVDWLTSITRSS